MIQTLLTMKSLFLTIAFVLAFLLSAHTQSCLPDGITFTTQGQIDSFPINYPGCKVIEGDVLVKSSSIVSLDSLIGVTGIHGNLEIHITSLKDFAGLDSLIFVDGDFDIAQNDSLISMLGLTSLKSVRQFIIRLNQRLASLKGLESIEQILYLSLMENESLVSVEELSNVTYHLGLYVADNYSLIQLPLASNNAYLPLVEIMNNAKLENFSGFETVDSIFILDLQGNGHLNSTGGIKDLVPFSSLSWARSIDIQGNNLYSTNGLNELVWLNDISIAEDSISAIEGFEKIDTIRQYIQLNCPKLENLNAFPVLKSIQNGVLLSDLDRIDSLTLFPSLESIGGTIGISDFDSLVDISKMGLLKFTKPGALIITNNKQLEKLDGLEILDTLIGVISIMGNAKLSNIDALANAVYFGESDFSQISGNPFLSDCSIASICNFFINPPEGTSLRIFNNSPGCNSEFEVGVNCGAKVLILNSLYLEENDCSSNAIMPAANVNFVFENSINRKTVSANKNGVVFYPVFTEDSIQIWYQLSDLDHWIPCEDSLIVDPTLFGDTILLDMTLRPVEFCSDIHVNLSLPPFFRGCLVQSPISFSAQNIGTIPAENSLVSIVAPLNVVDIMSSTPAPSWTNGDTLFYSLGDLDVFERLDIDLMVKTKCDTFLLGQTLCVEAFATFDNPCDPDPPIGSIVTIHPECIGDTLVEFTLTNIGDAPTMNDHDYFIIEDEVILKMAPFTLNPMQQMTVQAQADGSTFRMEATKLDNGTLTAAAIEGCGGLNPGLINAYWVDQGEAAYDKDCREVRLAYDPNEKSAVPTGVGPEHLMVANRPIQYTIDFQNTGTDTAYRVLIRDVLPAQLDVTSFRPLFATHDYTWQIYGNDTLEFLFQPIALPDSAANQEGSRGFVTFTIDQLPDLPNGTIIENSADIVFDFNPPIYTNTVTHTIGKLLVRITTPTAGVATWSVWGNPVGETALFKAHRDIVGTNQFELTDLSGRIIRSTAFQGNEFVFHRQGLAGGMYFFTITDERGGVCAGRIVVAE